MKFDPKTRKEAPLELLSLLGTPPPEQWLTYCRTISMKEGGYTPDVTDPMDIVFHTEEIFEHTFPGVEEITHHELTEELLVDVPLDSHVEEEDLLPKQKARTMFILLVIIVVLLFVLVYMQAP